MKVVAVGNTVLFLDLVEVSDSLKQWVEVSRVEVGKLDASTIDLAKEYALELDADFNKRFRMKFYASNQQDEPVVVGEKEPELIGGKTRFSATLSGDPIKFDKLAGEEKEAQKLEALRLMLKIHSIEGYETATFDEWDIQFKDGKSIPIRKDKS